MKEVVTINPFVAPSACRTDLPGTAGLRDTIAIARGEADPKTYRVHVPAEIDVRKIRKRLQLSQDDFAARFGIPRGTLLDWEQRRRRPEGAARALIVIDKETEAVTRALTSQRSAARPADRAPRRAPA
jgi:putative transcriptional regulator